MDMNTETTATKPAGFPEKDSPQALLCTLTEQTKQLAALAQKVTLVTAEPLKTGVAEAFNHAA